MLWLTKLMFDAVMSNAESGGSGYDPTYKELKQAISKWRFSVAERGSISDKCAFMNEGSGTLNVGELAVLLTELNDGIEVTEDEVQ